jgi:hypothetical protein
MTGGDLFLATARVGSPAQGCGSRGQWARGVMQVVDMTRVAGDLHVSARQLHLSIYVGPRKTANAPSSSPRAEPTTDAASQCLLLAPVGLRRVLLAHTCRRRRRARPCHWPAVDVYAPATIFSTTPSHLAAHGSFRVPAAHLTQRNSILSLRSTRLTRPGNAMQSGPPPFPPDTNTCTALRSRPLVDPGAGCATESAPASVLPVALVRLAIHPD